jgi:hypothetical protein
MVYGVYIFFKPLWKILKIFSRRKNEQTGSLQTMITAITGQPEIKWCMELPEGIDLKSQIQERFVIE